MCVLETSLWVYYVNVYYDVTGYGVFALQDFPKVAFLLEYPGELVSFLKSSGVYGIAAKIKFPWFPRF